MSIKKIVILMGLSVLFSACSTGGFNGENSQYANEGSGPTQMGERYLLGRGVEQNNEKAFGYFISAANNDDAFAENEVAYMYAAGKGTQQSYSKALFWYNKAAEHGLASAQYNLGLMYLHGLGTPPNKEQALVWLKKSAAHGFEPAIQLVSRS